MRRAVETEPTMVRGALVVPSPPMQLPEYVGLTDPAAEIRDRSVAALAETIAEWQPTAIAVLAGHDPLAEHSLGSVAARVAALLLAQAGWTETVRPIAIPFDASAVELDAAAARVLNGRNPGGTLLLVPADLSAKRTEAAPGHLDERAAGFDAAVLDALSKGDAATLRDADLSLAQDLWATGLAPLQVMARCLPAPVRSEILWSSLPYGVQYVRARWWGRRPGPHG
ncbi:MAG: hypothetical protein LCH77_12020 [Actinobacteria bacterium]|nr:hypothetical protein [Actinomycetota bacterium]